MRQLINGILLFAMLGATTHVLAEDIYYPGGKRPVLTIKEKVQRSLARASYAAEGRFVEPQPAAGLEELDDARGIHAVEFQPTRRLHGSAPADGKLVLKLVVYRPSSTRAPAPDAAALARSAELERNAGGKAVAPADYQGAINAARLPLLAAPGYLRDYFVVPVAVGGLDTPYRVADVVVHPGKRYLVFVLRDFAGGGSGPLFPNELDIYDADDPEVRAALPPAP